MGALIDVVGSVLSQSERRVEIAAQNLANVSTSGYKSIAGGASVFSDTTGVTTTSGHADLSPGHLITTHNPFDLAIVDNGYFQVRTDQGIMLTRGGAFQMGEGGRVVTAQGYALQADNGGDLILSGSQLQVQPDGVVIEDGQPVANVAVVDAIDPNTVSPTQDGLLTTPDSNLKAVNAPAIRQGALEGSNVSSADEMIAMMEAVRRAEAGQRMANVYDDLMGRVLQTFGQS